MVGEPPGTISIQVGPGARTIGAPVPSVKPVTMSAFGLAHRPLITLPLDSTHASPPPMMSATGTGSRATSTSPVLR